MHETSRDRSGYSRSDKDIRALKLTLGLYVMIFATKLTIYFMSGVMAPLGEAPHTLSDIFISGFLLVAIIWSCKEKDRIAEELREQVHKSIKGGYCVIHTDPAKPLETMHSTFG